MAGIQFILTNAMKDALRSRGFTDDEIKQTTPTEAQKILLTPDPRAVREFITAIATQAKAALAASTDPGLLQITRLHPTSESLVPSRFALDDIEHMVNSAIRDSEAGHNTYIEGRTVSTSLRGNVRGTLTETVAVFALIIDSDADKGMGWTPTATIRPSITVETSPGNFQFWFFLRAAINPELAQKLGERIRRAVNSDHDTGNPTPTLSHRRDGQLSERQQDRARTQHCVDPADRARSSGAVDAGRYRTGIPGIGTAQG